MSKSKNAMESILVLDDDKTIEPTVKEISKKVIVPSNYIEIKLDSLGKLSAPTTLHFRNYNMHEVLKLTTSRDIDKYSNIVECLNEMCFEDFDCMMDIERKYNISHSPISACCRNKRKSAGKDINGNKLHWMYYSEYLEQINGNKTILLSII